VTAGPQQFGRVCQVVIGNSSQGQGIVVEKLRIQFEVTQSILRTPNTATVKIYNLSQENEALIKGEFDEVLINAGYVNASKLIFAGNIRHSFAYADGPDRIMELDSADGDADFRNTVVNAVLTAGTTQSQAINQLASKFTTTKLGHMVVSDGKRIRGKVMSGPARKFFDEIAATNDAHWSIQNGVLQIVPVDSTLPTDAIVISIATGMLGAPELDDKGIKVTCLLNPSIRPNGKIWLNNNDIKDAILKQRASKPGAAKPKKPPKTKHLARTDPDGIYKVYKQVIKGDTRGSGKDWTSEVFAIALEKTIPSGKAAA
jgi:hypothetical protein